MVRELHLSSVCRLVCDFEMRSEKCEVRSKQPGRILKWEVGGAIWPEAREVTALSDIGLILKYVLAFSVILLSSC